MATHGTTVTRIKEVETIAMDDGNHGEVVHDGTTTTNGIPRTDRRRHQEGILRSGMRCDDDWRIHRTIVHPIQRVWLMGVMRMAVLPHVRFTCVYLPSLSTIYTTRAFGKNGLLPMLLLPT